MVLLETSYKVPFSVNQSSLKTFLFLYQAGRSLLSLVDTLLLINTKQLILWSRKEVPSKCNLSLMTDPKSKNGRYANIQRPVALEWVCTTQKTVFKVLLNPASSMLCKEKCLCIYQPRTLS